jgi:hypothetical protein
MMERQFSRMAFMDPPVVPDADGLEFDTIERKTLDYLKDEYYKAVSIDHLLKAWNRVTYEELEESTGFYFTIKTSELIGDSLKSSHRPHFTLASTLIFTKEELVAAIDNPYSVMRGVSRLLGHKALHFNVDSVQFDINRDGNLTANIAFDKAQLDRVHAGISYKVRTINFVLLPNASYAELKMTQVPTSFEGLTVGFSLQDLSIVSEPPSVRHLFDPTGEHNMRTIYNPSPINTSVTKRRTSSFLSSSVNLLGNPRKFSSYSKTNSVSSKSSKKPT